MSDTTGTPKQVFSQWVDWQHKFWKDWMDNASKGMEQMASIWQLDGGKVAPWFNEWYQNWKDAVTAATGGESPSLSSPAPARITPSQEESSNLRKRVVTFPRSSTMRRSDRRARA